jgi:hypothetical protein
MAGKVCGKCDSPNMSTARFCARCGAPLAGAPSAQGEEAPPGAPLRVLMWFLELFPGLVRPSVVIPFVLAMPLAAGLGYLGFFLLSMGGLFGGVAIAAFGLVVYWAAWTWMIYGYVCMPAEALAEFDGKRWLLFVLASVVPAAAVALKIGL